MKNSFITRKVTLNGLAPLMFDAFRGQEELPPDRKLYLSSSDQKTLIIPAANMLGFLASKGAHSCVKMFAPLKEYKKRSPEVMGNVLISPMEIPILDGDGQPILFDGEWTNKLHVDERMARPDPRVRLLVQRPVLNNPWSLEFQLDINPTDYVSEDLIRQWFEKGGTVVGILAFRPLFGRFEVTAWDKT